MRFPVTLLIFVLLAGCGDSKLPSPKLTLEQRSKIYAGRALEAPRTVVHKTASGDMVVMTIPTGGTSRTLETQRCFIWRDSEFKTTAMSCPGEQADVELTAER